MQVSFTLNTDKEIVWSLPGTQIMLTTGNPTAEVNAIDLSAQQRWVLAGAIQQGKITSPVTPAEIVEAEKSLDPVRKEQVQKAKEQVKLYKEDQNKQDVAGHAKKLLSGRAPTVKKEILNTTDIRLLKMMLALETGGKNRKSLVALLEQRVNRAEEEVAKSIADTSNPLVVPKKMPNPGGITYDADVVELEDETVEIDLSTGEILSD
jgi:hypothetical protein